MDATAPSLLDALFPPVYTRSITVWQDIDAAAAITALKAAWSHVSAAFVPDGGAARAEIVVQEKETLDDVASLVCSRELASPLSSKRDIHALVAHLTLKKDSRALAIGLASHHQLFDGRGHFAFIRSWTALAKGAAIDSPLLDRSSISALFTGAETASKTKDAGTEDLRRFGLVRLRDIGKKEKMERARLAVTARRFLITAAAIAQLKATSTSSSFTTNDVICALLWRVITHARLKAGLFVEGQTAKPTRLGFAVDIRNRCSPPLSEAFAGNATLLAVAESDDISALATASFPRLCELVRIAKDGIDSDHVNAALAALAREPCTVDFFGASDGNNLDLAVTNWTALAGCADADFVCGKPSRVIVPPGSSDGVVILLPNCADGGAGTGGLIAHVQLVEPAMAALLSDVAADGGDDDAGLLRVV